MKIGELYTLKKRFAFDIEKCIIGFECGGFIGQIFCPHFFNLNEQYEEWKCQ